MQIEFLGILFIILEEEVCNILEWVELDIYNEVELVVFITDHVVFELN